MATLTEKCTICSKLLFSSGNVTEKLLKTPCSHLFHRTCLKTWLRGTATISCCPDCTTPVTWQEVSCWRQESQGNKNARVRKEEANNDSTVASLLEETRQKNAEVLVQKRLSRDSKQKLLELQQQETLERQKALAEKKKLANIQDKMCKGYARRTRVKFLKRVILGTVLVFIFGCLGVYSYQLYHQINQTELHELRKACLRKSNALDQLTDEFNFKLQMLKNTKNPETFEEKYALHEEFEAHKLLGKEIKALREEFNDMCVEKLEIGKKKDIPDDVMVDFMRAQSPLIGNGWSMNEFFAWGKKYK